MSEIGKWKKVVYSSIVLTCIIVSSIVILYLSITWIEMENLMNPGTGSSPVTMYGTVVRKTQALSYWDDYHTVIYSYVIRPEGHHGLPDFSYEEQIRFAVYGDDYYYSWSGKQIVEHNFEIFFDEYVPNSSFEKGDIISFSIYYDRIDTIENVKLERVRE